MKNYLCIENINLSSNDTLLQIIQSSSEMEGYPITNILESDEKTLWLSTEELPQEIIINIKKDFFKEMPKKISAIGIYCWHAYPTNPKLIEIQISKNNGITFISLGNFDLCLKPGKQLLQFDYELNPPLVENKFDFVIKLIIKETFGDKRTYINNIFLYENINNINIAQKKLMTNMETIKEEDSNSAIYLRESREKIITKNIKEIDTIEENKDKINSDESQSLISDSDLTEKYNNKKNKERNEIKSENIKNNERYNENDNENDILYEMNKQINLMLEKDEMKDIQQENEISSKEKSLNINDFNNEEEENENEVDNNNNIKDNKKDLDENNSLNDIINEENIDLLLEEFENYKRIQEKRMIDYEIKIKNLEVQFQEMAYLNNKMKDTLDTLLESQIIQQNNNQENIINNMKDIINYKINNVFNNFPNYNYGYNNTRNNYFYNNNPNNINITKRINNKNEKEKLIKRSNLINRNNTEGNYYNNNYNLNNINDINNNNYQNYPSKITKYPTKNKNKRTIDINIKKDKYNNSFQKNTKINKQNKKDNI